MRIRAFVTGGLLIAAFLNAASPAGADNIPQVSGTPRQRYQSVCVEQDRMIPAAPFRQAQGSDVCKGLSYGGLVAMATYTGSDDLDKLTQDLKRGFTAGAPIAVGRDSHGLWVFVGLRDEVGVQGAMGNIEPLDAYGFQIGYTG